MSRLLRRVIIAAITPAVTLGTGCARRAPVRNLVVITLDTTRADRLPAYGFGGVETPALDRIAREGVVFDDATTVAPLTFPAHASLFTGRLPFHHGVRDNAGGTLPPSQVTLAERVHARGWQTAAFVGSVVLRAGRGLDRGFDRYVAPTRGACPDLPPRRRGDEVVTDALRWLTEARAGRFFIWIHLYDAHRPYDMPVASQAPYDRAPYLAALSFMDAQAGRVLAFLDREGLTRSSAVVVAGDHGEGLGDHGERSHGIFLYQSVLHVPLLMRIPGVAPRRIAGPTSLVDVMPTLLDLAGAAAAPVDGVSLVETIRGRTPRRDIEAYSESWYPERFGWSRLRSLRDGRYKVIAAPRPELYDLLRDPLERANLFDGRRALGTAMLERLARYETPVAVESSPESSLDSATRDALAALGYVGHSPRVPAPGRSAPAVDPKDRIAAYEHLIDPGRAHTRPACGTTAAR